MKRQIYLILAVIFSCALTWAEDRSIKEEGRVMELATFAGGCFWCMEPPFENLKGVTKIMSGYTGGQKENPTYEQVSSGSTGHAEAVEITFDPKETSFEKLLDIFWRNIDPTDSSGQFVDKGSQYRTAIFYHNEDQKQIAIASKEKLAKSGVFDKPIVTEIVPASKFYEAEKYHQGFCRLNPARYKTYRFFSGRDQFLEKTWGKEKKK